MNVRADFSLPDQFGIGQARVAAIRIATLSHLITEAGKRIASPIEEVSAAARITHDIAQQDLAFARAVLVIHSED